MNKILLIPNMPYWSLDKNAKDIIKYNRSNFDFDIVYFPEAIKNWPSLYRKYDLLFPMYMNLFFKLLDSDLPVEKVITGIRSYVIWDKQKSRPPGYDVEPPRSIIRRLNKALLVNTISKKLWYIFSNYLPVVHTKYTCDLETFFPQKHNYNKMNLRVGWTGSLTNHGGVRGIEDIIIPACDGLENIELIIQNSEKKWIRDDHEMRSFYNSIDVYICASYSEGSPRPIMEASACGTPVLAVDVGMVPEVVENGKTGFIVERTIEAFRNKLKWLEKNRGILIDMGKAAREKMEQEFNWNCIINQWIDFFRQALELYQIKER